MRPGPDFSAVFWKILHILHMQPSPFIANGEPGSQAAKLQTSCSSNRSGPQGRRPDVHQIPAFTTVCPKQRLPLVWKGNQRKMKTREKTFVLHQMIQRTDSLIHNSAQTVQLQNKLLLKSEPLVSPAFLPSQHETTK